MAASENDNPFDEATNLDSSESTRLAREGNPTKKRILDEHQIRTTIDTVAPAHRHQESAPPIRPQHRPPAHGATAEPPNEDWAPLYLDDEVLDSGSVNFELNKEDLAAIRTATPAPPADSPSTAAAPRFKPAPIRVKRNQDCAPSSPRKFSSGPVATQIMSDKAVDPNLIEGSRIGNYEVIGKIGQGGMGVVYEGHHLLLPRRVAIKFLLTNASHDEEQIRRFLGEAVASAQIGHKGVVDIYDYGYNEDKTAYLIMEFVEGQSLQAIMRHNGQLPVPMAIRVVRDIAEVLAAAHQCGIVHRDLKPDNMILSRDEFGKDYVKILDFGVAKFVNDQGLSGQTVAGSILGTPWYMPPEQCQGLREVDFRSDIYALGCVFYQMLCGKVPFAGSLRDVLTSHIHSQAIPPSQLNPSIPQAIEKLIARMMAKEPADRPHSMDEVAHVLAGLAEATSGHPAATGPSPGTTALRSKHGHHTPAEHGQRWLMPVLAAIVACAGTSAAFYFLQG